MVLVGHEKHENGAKVFASMPLSHHSRHWFCTQKQQVPNTTVLASSATQQTLPLPLSSSPSSPSPSSSYSYILPLLKTPMSLLSPPPSRTCFPPNSKHSLLPQPPRTVSLCTSPSKPPSQHTIKDSNFRYIHTT